LALDRFQLLYELQDSDSDWSVKRNYLSSNPYLTTEQIDLLYPDESVDKIGLAQFPKLTDEQFMRLFNDGAKNYLARNPNLTPKQIDLLYDAGGDKDYLAQYPKLTDEQFLRLFQDDDVKIIKYLARNPNLTPEQIDLLYQTVQGVNEKSLAMNPKLTEKQFMRFFNDEDFNKDYLASNSNLTTEQIDLLYQTEGVDKDQLARFPKLTNEQFMRLFNEGQNQNADLLFYLAQNPNLTPKQIDLLYDAGSDKESLAQYPKLTDEQFLRAFNDGLKYKLLLTKNPSINAPANKPFASGIFNWSW